LVSWLETKLRTRRRGLGMLGGAPNFISHNGFGSGSGGGISTLDPPNDG